MALQLYALHIQLLTLMMTISAGICSSERLGGIAENLGIKGVFNFFKNNKNPGIALVRMSKFYTIWEEPCWTMVDG
ncbi:hypothetical protein [Endozoicomonas sp.]|uniref:hypothetical protein n=1 Tax=Endozoicomonas sp. TaxID=1892382 RepID=UPI002883AEDB|nr:hypothetical protein [Endozoicomonas sp.]